MIVFPEEAMPEATIVVVGLRRAPLLLECLESIARRATGIPYELRVVLNDPSPLVCTQLDREVRGAHVSKFRANLGFGGAVNFAAGEARGHHLVLVNDDCTVAPNWLEALFDTQRRRPHCGLVGSKVLHPDGSLQEAGAIVWSDGTTATVGDGERPDFMHFERKVDYCGGSSLLVRKDVWDELGGFDDRYYPAYYEDVDLCLRAAAIGSEVWYQPLSVVHHARSASTTKLERGFLLNRSRRTFLERWSGSLGHQEPSASVERAVWRAMGEPRRVLLIDQSTDDDSATSGTRAAEDEATALSKHTDTHVAFCSGRTLDARIVDDLAVAGVRVISDLDSHLAAEGIDYEDVMISSATDSPGIRELIDHRLPRARVVPAGEPLSTLHTVTEPRSS